MSKNFDRKKALVSEISDKLSKATSVVLVDYMGINVDEATELRTKCREQGIEYKVYKNKLFKRASEGTQFEGVSKDLAGPNAFAFSYDDPTICARVLNDFAKNSKKFELRSGVVDGVYYEKDGIEKIAKIPPRDELLAKLLGSIKSPISNFAYLLKAISEKKEEEGGETAEPKVEEAKPEEIKAEEVTTEENVENEKAEEVKKDDEESKE